MTSFNFFTVFNSSNSHQLANPAIPSERFLFCICEQSFDASVSEERFAVLCSRDVEIVADFQQRISGSQLRDVFCLIAIDSKISVDAFKALSSNSEFVVRLNMFIHSFIEVDHDEMNMHGALLERIVRAAAKNELQSLDGDCAESHELDSEFSL